MYYIVHVYLHNIVCVYTVRGFAIVGINSTLKPYHNVSMFNADSIRLKVPSPSVHSDSYS